MRNFTDKELYTLCKKYGENALHWRHKFIGLLPEVNHRRLYEKKGFHSIFEFAKKLCGLSEEQVRRVLNIVSVATPENEDFWAEKMRQLSQSAIETLVRDEKQNSLLKPQNEAKSVRAHKLQLDDDKEYGDKCSIESCARSAQVIHHTQRFALATTHNPKYLAPLCREHHTIAHAIDAKVQAKK